MGEYAEMMLDGTCCAACGEFMGDGDGFASYCSPECAGEHGATHYGTGDGLTAPDPKPHKCDQCDRSFAKAGGLKMHKEAKHPPDKLECPECGKMCAGAYGLQQHMNAKGCGLFSKEFESPVKIANRKRRESGELDVLDDGDDFGVVTS